MSKLASKPSFLWHGSAKLIEGCMFIPRKARDVGNTPENSLVAVYATDKKQLAITMALLNSNGMKRGSLSFCALEKGIAFEGWPTQEYVYLYELPSTTFTRTSEGSNQWASSEPVPFVDVEKIAVKDVIHLIRKPTEEEKTNYEKKYGVKLRD